MRRNGLIAIGLDDDDELLAVDLSSGDRDVLLATHDGMAMHFSEKDVRPMGRPARGVKAITLAKGDEVVAMDIVEDDRTEVLIVTSQGVRKAHADRRLPPHLARRQRRQGVREGERDRPRRRPDLGRSPRTSCC